MTLWCVGLVRCILCSLRFSLCSIPYPDFFPYVWNTIDGSCCRAELWWMTPDIGYFDFLVIFTVSVSYTLLHQNRIWFLIPALHATGVASAPFACREFVRSTRDVATFATPEMRCSIDRPVG